MSILIKGMEMPDMCSECEFCGGLICPDNIYTCDCPSNEIHGANITRAIDEDCRHPDCPLIPVPPHGDLIERDALIEALAKMVPWAIADPSANAFLDGLSAAYEAIKTAPTIIQADKEE